LVPEEPERMWAPIICAGIWLGFILYWMAGSLPKNRIYEIYAGCGIGVCLSLLLFGVFGWYRPHGDSLPLRALALAGTVLYWASVLLVLLAFLALARRGRPEGFIERSTVLIDSGLFGVIRHPLYLGVALWSIGLVLRIQLALPAMLAMVAFGCAWLAGMKEDEFNVRKFGEGYREYMAVVPAWNVWKGLRRRFLSGRGDA
jgi:protein-S-isoprenylcysteine O-methyltransferase Ste14